MIRAISLLDEMAAPPRTVDEGAGFGALKTEKGCLPLTGLAVRARVTGLVAEITVRQTFRNTLDVPIEATYIFPLPDRAAVTSFRMEVAGRVIEGLLKERGEAREEYEKAIREGHRAAIAEEERSGTFSLRVGNIPPKEQVTVELALSAMLPFSAGEATFRFPLVVAPRYVPGIPLDGPPVGLGWGEDTTEAPDASRITPPVLLPGFPNPVCLSLEVEIDPAGLDAADENWAGRIRSSLHSVLTESGPPWKIRLQPGERLDRDFILRFPLAAAAVQTAMSFTPGQGDQPGTFALTIVPPAMSANNRPAPRDVVLVLDRSGSMQGWKMVAARRAAGRMIDTLLDHDRLIVLAFDNDVEYPPESDRSLVEASNRTRWRMLEWLGKIEARGGTEMRPALEAAMRLLAGGDPGRERIVVMVTDGQVAGEDAVLKALSRTAAGAMPRIHTLGIDQAVNAGFLRRLADLGRGVCDLVESESQLDAAMERIHRMIGQPVLTQLRLEPIPRTSEVSKTSEVSAWQSDSLTPSRLPDVFADCPVTIFGRFSGDGLSLGIRIRAVDATGKPWVYESVARPASLGAMASVWGRAKVRELEDRYAAGTDPNSSALAKQIVDISLATHVLSRFTAYVAVDRSEVVNRDGPLQEILQPVEMPRGWDMGVRTLTCLGSPRSAVAMTCYLDASCEHPAAPASAPVRSQPGVFRSLGERLFRKRSHSADQAHPPASSDMRQKCEAIADRLREAIDRVPNDRALVQRQKWLEQVITHLEVLLSLAGIPTQTETALKDVLQRARDLLAVHAGGDKDALGDAGFTSLVDSLRAALLGGPIEEQPRREFWK